MQGVGKEQKGTAEAGLHPQALETIAETPQQQQTHPSTTFPLQHKPPKTLPALTKSSCSTGAPREELPVPPAHAERRDPELSNETGIYLVQALRICSLVVGSYYQTELRYQ